MCSMTGRHTVQRMGQIGSFTTEASSRGTLSKLLSSLTSNTELVRHLMKVRRVVITGPAALAYGMHTLGHQKLIIPPKIDMICPNSQYPSFIEELFELLTDSTKAASVCVDNYITESTNKHVVQDFTFDLGRVKVVVHCSETEDVIKAVLDQWASHHLNVLTHERYVMGYPQFTLTLRGFVRARDLTNEEIEAMAGDIKAGFDFRYRANTYRAGASMYKCDMYKCPRTVRWFGDEGCVSATIYRLEEETTQELWSTKWVLLGEGCNDLCEEARNGRRLIFQGY